MADKISNSQLRHILRSAVDRATKGKQTTDLIATHKALEDVATKLAERIAKRASEKLCPTSPNDPRLHR